MAAIVMLRAARDITADLVDLGGEPAAALAIGTVTTLSAAVRATTRRRGITTRGWLTVDATDDHDLYRAAL